MEKSYLAIFVQCFDFFCGLLCEYCYEIFLMRRDGFFFFLLWNLVMQALLSSLSFSGILPVSTRNSVPVCSLCVYGRNSAKRRILFLIRQLDSSTESGVLYDETLFFLIATQCDVFFFRFILFWLNDRIKTIG